MFGHFTESMAPYVVIADKCIYPSKLDITLTLSITINDSESNCFYQDNYNYHFSFSRELLRALDLPLC